ncbi:transglycosylase domain-containing protein [Frigoribacterium salinisoli]
MSAQKSKPTSVVGALFGFIGFSALAGLLVTIGVTPAIAVAGMTASSSIGVFESIPEYIELGKLQQRNTLYGTSNGQPVQFATLYSENRVELGWDEVSDNLKSAAVDGEDRRFYDHGGVDVTSLVRAAVGTVGSGELGASGGGSTLTMQLVRNILITQAQQLSDPEEQKAAYAEATDTSIERKLQEMKFAIGLEKKYSKDEILLAYLNIAYFGDQTYGVQAAAQHYYNKSAADLSPVEAASLIAIVQYPDSRNLSSPDNYEANKARRDVILRSMLAEGTIDQATYDTSVGTDVASYVVLTPATQGCSATSVPAAAYFCDYVKKSIKDVTVLGANAEERERNWATGGYEVFTTINLDLTQSAKQQIDTYAPASETRLKLGSVVNSVEAGTGRVIVMAQNTAFNEIATDDRTQSSVNYSTDSDYGSSTGFQVGSTYKPFTLIDWLEQGHGVNESVNASNRTFRLTADGRPATPWAPQNDGNGRFGRITAAQATAQSVNTGYFAMAQQLDLIDIRDAAQSLGVHRADGGDLQYENPTSILGTNEIAPLTMAAAYAGIASGGTYCDPIIIDNIRDDDGKDLGGQDAQCRQALDPQVASGAIRAMSGLWTSGTGVGALPYDGMPEIGKTGTTDDADQVWIIGATSKLATAVWQGNTDGAKTSLRRTGSSNLPGTYYAYQRNAFFRSVQTVNNTVYPGEAFPEPDSSVLRGNGVAVPELEGTTAAAARSLLQGVGLRYVDGGTRPSSLPRGQVVSADPAAGALVARGSRVTVYLSDQSQAAAVPSVQGDDYDDAVSKLTGAGFDAANISVRGFQAGDDDDQCRVVGTDPAAGSTIPMDSAVGVVLSGTSDGGDPGTCS